MPTIKAIEAAANRKPLRREHSFQIPFQQDPADNMSVLVTQQAPEFKAQAVMPDGQFKEVSLSDYRGKYVVLFFYPLDFTFVCPTEIIAFDKRIGEFEKRGVKVVGIVIPARDPLVARIEHRLHLAFVLGAWVVPDGGPASLAVPLAVEHPLALRLVHECALASRLAPLGAGPLVREVDVMKIQGEKVHKLSSYAVGRIMK